MEKESIQLVLDYLDKVAAKLGTSSEQIWPWFIRQQYVEAIYYGAVGLIMAGILGFASFFCAKHWNPDSGYSICASDHEPGWVCGLIGWSCISLPFIILGISEFPDIFNPEYHAMRSIISMAK